MGRNNALFRPVRLELTEARERIPPANKTAEKALCARCGKVVKIGGTCRPILVAGIRVGVAEHPRLGSHRTAEPTVQGFFALKAIGVEIDPFYAFGVEGEGLPQVTKKTIGVTGVKGGCA